MKGGNMEWQPIETAPRDGSYYLARVKHYKNKDTVFHVVGRFEEDGFYLEDRSELSYNLNPTHWMPLPEPPKE